MLDMLTLWVNFLWRSTRNNINIFDFPSFFRLRFSPHNQHIFGYLNLPSFLDWRFWFSTSFTYDSCDLRLRKQFDLRWAFVYRNWTISSKFEDFRLRFQTFAIKYHRDYGEITWNNMQYSRLTFWPRTKTDRASLGMKSKKFKILESFFSAF